MRSKQRLCGYATCRHDQTSNEIENALYFRSAASAPHFVKSDCGAWIKFKYFLFRAPRWHSIGRTEYVRLSQKLVSEP